MMSVGQMSVGQRAKVIAVAAAVLTLMAGTPAQAHDSLSSFGGVVWRGGTSQNPQCIQAIAKQNHGGALLSRYVETDSMGYCGQYLWRPKGYIAQRGSVYYDGQFCFAGGWIYSQSDGIYMTYSSNYDVWRDCNRGPGVNTYITHDTQHAVVSIAGAWIVADAPRPTTGHCHCP